MKRAALSTVELAYIDRGTGPPVLLVHGFPLDHTMWSAQIDALAERCRVIAPDLRGFGQSPLGNADPQRGISMEQYADDLAELLDALGNRRADRAGRLFDGRLHRLAICPQVRRPIARR